MRLFEQSRSTRYVLTPAAFTYSLTGFDFRPAELVLQRLGTHDVVSLDPAGRADGEPRLGAGSEVAGGLAVAAQEGGLGGREIGLRIVSLPAIGHRELGKAERRFRLARHRRAQDADR